MVPRLAVWFPAERQYGSLPKWYGSPLVNLKPAQAREREQLLKKRKLPKKLYAKRKAFYQRERKLFKKESVLQNSFFQLFVLTFFALLPYRKQGGAVGKRSRWISVGTVQLLCELQCPLSE